MNGIYIINWIEDETEAMCFEHKKAFMQEVLDDLNEYIVEFKMNKVSPNIGTTETNLGESSMNIEKIAQVAHETNRHYCQSIGDSTQVLWIEAPQWQKDSAIKGVQFHIDNPEAGCAASHESWLKEKEEAGWKYGEIKDVDKKEHPCFVPYNELPVDQQVKDALFVGVVRAMKILLSPAPPTDTEKTHE